MSQQFFCFFFIVKGRFHYVSRCLLTSGQWMFKTTFLRHSELEGFMFHRMCFFSIKACTTIKARIWKWPLPSSSPSVGSSSPRSSAASGSIAAPLLLALPAAAAASSSLLCASRVNSDLQRRHCRRTQLGRSSESRRWFSSATWDSTSVRAWSARTHVCWHCYGIWPFTDNIPF